MIQDENIEKRRIVYSALANHLKEERLLEALWLWEQKYALSSGLELRKYVSEIVNEDDHPELKSQVYKSLTKATYFPGEIELLPDPYDSMQKYKERCNGAFKYINAITDDIKVPFSTIVFSSVVASLLAQMKKQDSVSCLRIVNSIKVSVLLKKLKTTQYDELNSWLDNTGQTLKLIYPENFMHAFVNQLYVISCEKFGPVVSDNMLSNSITEASNLKEARFYNPKRLL